VKFFQTPFFVKWELGGWNMFIGKEFNSDHNSTLRAIQVETYYGLLFHLFHYPRNKYVKACKFVGVRTKLFDKIRYLNCFDANILQKGYEVIAAFYRFTYDFYGQMKLPLDGKTYEERTINNWRNFFLDECREIAEEDSIARTILDSVAYSETTYGIAAKDNLPILLMYYYGEDFCHAIENYKGGFERIIKDPPKNYVKRFNL